MRFFLHHLIFILPIFINGQIENEILDSPPTCGRKLTSNLSTETNTKSGEYPWVVLIGYENLDQEKKFYACTGSLMNEQYVLTTAVCLSQQHSNYQMTHVRIGEYNIHEDFDCHGRGNNPCVSITLSIDVKIGEAFSHPSYNSNGYQSHNVALIKLEEPINFSEFDGFVSPICLPPAGFDSKLLLRDQMGEVVGWDFGSGHPNHVLMREPLLLAEDKICEMWFTGFAPETELCMKSEKIRRRCTGDSGSPLTAVGPEEKVLLLGMLSYGPIPCGFSDSPSVFTSISYFRDWIDGIIAPLNDEDTRYVE